MTKTREELEKIIADAQEELKRLDEKLVIFDGWRPAINERFFIPLLTLSSDKTAYGYNSDGFTTSAIERCAAFRTPEQAAAVADAICVMLELRNQPGAFQSSPEDTVGGYIIQYNSLSKDCEYEDWGSVRHSFVCPCFPSKEACEQAVDAVGRERVERALKLWAGVPL